MKVRKGINHWVFAIIDVWDALRNDRPYRAAWPEAKMREYLREQNGPYFDPAVVEAFFSIVDDKFYSGSMPCNRSRFS